MYILRHSRTDDQSLISSTRSRTTRRGQRTRAMLAAGVLMLAGVLGPAVTLGTQTASHAASAPQTACSAADTGCAPIRRA